jgi:hypothetical protein
VTLSSKVAFLIPLYAQVNQMKLLENYGKDFEEYTTISNDLFKELFMNKRERIQKLIRKRSKTDSEGKSPHRM